MMTVTELKSKAFEVTDIKNIPNLHQAIMEDVCETVLSRYNDNTAENELIRYTRLSFIASLRVAKKLLSGALPFGEMANLHYRGNSNSCTDKSELNKMLSETGKFDFRKEFNVPSTN